MFHHLFRGVYRLFVPDILTRMIVWELVKVFGMALVGITSILLIAGVVAEATQQGLSLTQVISVIPLLIPSTLPYTIPATTLFATCVVYGRLAADNEILAIKAAGINVAKVMWPAVMLGIVMSTVTMVLYYRTIPATHATMRTLVFNEVEEGLYAVLRRDMKINEPRLNYAVWVRQVQGRKLINSLFKRRGPDGLTYDVIAMAREADLRVDLPRRQVLLNMRNGMLMYKGTTSVYFNEKVWPIPLPASFGLEKSKRPRDLTWKEIGRRRVELEQSSEDAIKDFEVATALVRARLHRSRRELADVLAAAPLGPLHLTAALPFKGTGMYTDDGDFVGEVLPEQMTKHMVALKERHRSIENEILALDAEKQMRPALAFGCLCFVLIGCPIGIWFSRSDYLSAFITCFLPIVFVYYPLMLCGTNLAKDGQFDPVLTIWFADALLALVGVILFRRMMKN